MKAKLGSRNAVTIWFWVAAVAVGSICMARYDNAAGPDSAAPREWPGESEIARSGETPTLVMFVHPECPCTRASLGELARILAQCPGRARVFVLVLHDAGLLKDAEETPIWRAAAAIPGVKVLRDWNGTEARAFHAMTSGRAMLYDPAGRLLFAGGITMARGHAGDNDGSDALCALLWGREPARTATPVFGCPLFTPCSTPFRNKSS
jgi:hypothetical protein